MRSGPKNVLAALGIFLLAWGAIRFLLPLVSPFLLGLALALAAEPVVSLLQKRLHIPRGISTGIGVTMACFLLAMLLLLTAAFLVRELRGLAGVLPDLEGAARSGLSGLQGWLLEQAARMPQSLRPVLQERISGFFSGSSQILDKAMGYLLGLAGGILSHVPDSALGLGTAVFSGYMFSVRLPRIRRWCLRRIPRERLKAMAAAVRRIRCVLGGWLAAQARLVGVTFVIVFLGLVLLRIPYALVWALCVSLVDIFPVLGTGTVLIPWSVLCFLQGDTPRAIGIAGIYATVTLVRSILEPKFLGRHLGLDPLVTLIAMYTGYKLGGIGGMILAPALAVLAVQIAPEGKREDKM